MPDRKINVPTALAQYVVKKRMVNEFKLYMYLKFNSSYKIHKNDEAFLLLLRIKGFKSHKTISKHLKRLLSLNWIGYSEKSGNYFIRSFKEICDPLEISTQNYFPVSNSQITDLDVILGAAVINDLIRGQVLYYEKILPKKAKAAAMNLESQREPHHEPELFKSKAKPDYYGCGSTFIGTELGHSQSWGIRVRQKAAKSGLLKSKKKSAVVLNLQNRDPFVREWLCDEDPSIKGRLFFRKARRRAKNGEPTPKPFVQVMRRLHNEIIPLMEVRTKRNWTKRRMKKKLIDRKQKR